MSVVNIINTGDAVHMYTDAGALDSTGSISALLSKTRHFPHLNTIAGYTGQVWFFEHLTSKINHMYSSLDDLVLSLSEFFRDEYKKNEETILKFGPDFVLIVAGWSPSRNRFEIHGIASHALNDLNFGVESEPFKVFSWPVYAFLPAHRLVESHLVSTKTAFDENCGVKIADFQRTLKGKNSEGIEICGVSGFIEETVLSKGGITNRIVKRYDDHVGAPVFDTSAVTASTWQISGGTKGEISVGSNGADWTLNAGTVTNAKVAFAAGIDLSKLALGQNAAWSGTHTWSAGGNVYTGAPGVDVTIGENPWFISASKTWQLAKVAAASATLPETGVQSIVNSSAGGANPHTAFKVAMFGVAKASPGSADVYGGNFVSELASGVSSSITAISLEADINVHNVDYGNTYGPPSTPYACSLYLANGGTKKATSAQIVNCMGTDKYNRGLVFFNGTINLNTIEDWTTSGGFATVGGTKSYGIDMAPASISQSAIRLGVNQYITWRNAANTADQKIFALGSDNNFYVTNIPGGFLSVQANIAPTADNAYSLGASGARWSTVYAATGTINTSDPDLKTDKQPLPDGMLNVVKSIEPMTFRWKSGGTDTEEVEEEQLVQDETIEVVETDAVEERDGKFYAVKRMEERRAPAFDVVPVLGEDGNQVVKVEQTKTGPVEIPQTHAVPRLVRKVVKVQKAVDREGRRTHWGFMADNVRDAVALTGRDFAGYVELEDGTKGLRPDQLIPILWKAVQELSVRLEAVEAH